MGQTILLKLVVLGLCLTAVLGGTIRQIIEERRELEQLKEYMQRGPLTLLSTLGRNPGDGTAYTFFAPSNEAFENTPPEIKAKYRADSTVNNQELNGILKYHTVSNRDGSTIREDQIQNSAVKTMETGGPNLFLQEHKGKHYVNGAKIVTGDIEASNGVVHIIDAFLYKKGLSKNILSYIEDMSINPVQSKRTGRFRALLRQYEMSAHTAIDHLNGEGRLTVFVPTDEFLDRMDNNYYQELNGDPKKLKKAIESHIIVDNTMHLPLLNLTAQEPTVQLIDALEGDIIPKKFGMDVYVSNDCVQGRIVEPDITLSNGVVHYVDALLGYLYQDALSLIKRDNDLQSWESHVTRASPELMDLHRAPGATEVQERNKYTFFAPNNMALSRITDQTQNLTALDKVIRMHMIPGVIDVITMANTRELDTAQPGIKAYFSTDDDGNMYVKVDHIRAKIIKGDVCVKNGMVHYVDKALGLPISSIYEEVVDNDLTEELHQTVIKLGFQNTLTSDQITLFAPVDQAFEIMREGRIGRDLLGTRNLDKLSSVMNRHVLDYHLYMDTIDQPQTVYPRLKGDRGSFTINKVGQDYIIDFKGKQIKVLPYDLKMTNGVLHFIDQVIYQEDPLELELTSGSVTLTPHIITASCLLLVCFMMFGRV